MRLCPKKIAGALAGLLSLAAAPAFAAPPGKPVGTVSIDQGQAGFIVSAGYGGGVVTFRGKSYAFQIGGLGLGAIGASSLQATGQIYNMTNISQFPGLYGQARVGAVIGDKSIGSMWLRNENGVVMYLKARRKGLMLATGADAIVVKMK